jgi:hypothetical protein
VQEISSPIRDLGMNRPSSMSMASALRAGESRFQVAIKALGLDRWQSRITECGKRAQPQIDSHTRHRAIEDRADRWFISLIRQCAGHTDIQIPASAAVFTKITGTQFEASETVAVPQRQPPSREVDLSASIANRSDLEGNPAEGPASTTTLAPGESNFSMLPAPPRVFFRDLLYRLDGKMQSAVAARDPFEKRPKIKSRQKPSLALEHFGRQVVAIIKDRVDLAGQAAQPRGVLVLHPQAQDPNSGRSRTGHPYSIPKTYRTTSSQTSRNADRGRQARRRVSLSLAGLKAGVSREEIG